MRLGLGTYDLTSGDGTLLYVAADVAVGSRASLVWVDREGNEESVVAEPRNYLSVRLSPQGHRIATTIGELGALTPLYVKTLLQAAWMIS